MVHERVRVRFSKQGDLRLVSHRDLARTLERLFRRARVAVCQSQGFHPKPRMMFPSALALGIAGVDEVVEVDLEVPCQLHELLDRLTAQAPSGLSFHSAEIVPAGSKKAQAKSQTLEAPIPGDRLSEVADRVQTLLAASSYRVERKDRGEQLDVRPLIEELSLSEGVLRLKLRIAQEASARPRDILLALGLTEPEVQALALTRTAVELQP